MDKSGILSFIYSPLGFMETKNRRNGYSSYIGSLYLFL